jgi:hypothetical protein
VFDIAIKIYKQKYMESRAQFSMQQLSNLLLPHGKYLGKNKIADFAHFVYISFYKEKIKTFYF